MPRLQPIDSIWESLQMYYQKDAKCKKTKTVLSGRKKKRKLEKDLDFFSLQENQNQQTGFSTSSSPPKKQHCSFSSFSSSSFPSSLSSSSLSSLTASTISASVSSPSTPPLCFPLSSSSSSSSSSCLSSTSSSSCLSSTPSSAFANAEKGFAFISPETMEEFIKVACQIQKGGKQNLGHKTESLPKKKAATTISSSSSTMKEKEKKGEKQKSPSKEAGEAEKQRRVQQRAHQERAIQAAILISTKSFSPLVLKTTKRPPKHTIKWNRALEKTFLELNLLVSEIYTKLLGETKIRHHRQHLDAANKLKQILKYCNAKERIETKLTDDCSIPPLISLHQSNEC